MGFEQLKKYAVLTWLLFIIAMFTKPALCFVMIGFIFVLMGVMAIRFLNKIAKVGIHAVGKTLGYESDREGHKTPFIAFTTEKGEYIQAKPFVHASTDASIFRSYKSTIDQPIEIIYDPNSPEKFVLANDDGFNYGVFLIFVIIGLLGVGFGIGSLFGLTNMG